MPKKDDIEEILKNRKIVNDAMQVADGSSKFPEYVLRDEVTRLRGELDSAHNRIIGLLKDAGHIQLNRCPEHQGIDKKSECHICIRTQKEAAHKQTGYCTSCNEWPWHKCVFCGKEKRTAECLLPCRIRHQWRHWFGLFKLMFQPTTHTSPWQQLRRQVNAKFYSKGRR